MRNPWLKKNPLMSMWLSGANAVWGAARGRATGAARRQSQTIMENGAREMMKLWSGGFAAASAKPPRRRKRKTQ